MAKQKSQAGLAAEASSEDAKGFIRRLRRTTRRRYTPEEKVRIVLESFRGEIGIMALCRGEGIHRTAYYRSQFSSPLARQHIPLGHTFVSPEHPCGT